MEEHGIKVKLLTDNPILGYKKFKVNDDNFIYMGSDKRVSAKLQLMADDGTGVHIYSNDENTEALQDMTIGLKSFDLEKVLTVVPYMPDITGIMNGDFHIIQMPDEMSVSASMSVDNMTYERSRMGNLSTEFVYMPKSDGTHTVNGVLNCNDAKSVTTDGGAMTVTGLTPGWYVAMETKAPSDYILDSTPQVFHLLAATGEQALYFFNAPKPNNHHGSGGGSGDSTPETPSNPGEPLIGKLTLQSPILCWLIEYIEDRIADDRRWNVSGEIKRFGKNIFNKPHTGGAVLGSRRHDALIRFNH